MFKLVPYAEPSWLSPAYQSPYYNDVCSIISFTLTQKFIIIIKQSHKALQKWMRKFVDEIIIPDAIARENDGKRCSDSVIQKMSYVLSLTM